MASEKPVMELEDAQGSGLSRRQYFGLMGVLGAGMTAGCIGGDDDDDDDDDVDTDSRDDDDDSTDFDPDAERHGGTFRYITRGTLDGLDLHVVGHGPPWQNLEGNCIERLFRLNPDGTLHPRLATGLEFEDDGETVYVELREGVEFHPPVSRELIADDILYNWFRVLDPDNYGGDAENYTDHLAETGGRQGNVDLFDEVYKIDDHTIELRTDTPNSFMDFNMADRGQGIYAPENIRGEADVGGPDEHPVGTGPFKFDEWIPREHIRLTRFEDYWATHDMLEGREDMGDHQLPYVDEVEALIIGDETVQIEQMINENVDGVRNPSLHLLERLHEADNVNVVQSELIDIRYGLHANCTDHVSGNRNSEFPTMQWETRRAIQAAIDQEDYLQLGLGGSGVTSQSYYPEQHFFGHDYAPFATGANPEEAEEYLEEAGFDLPVEVVVNVSSEDNVLLSMGEIAVEHLEAGGFDVDLNAVESTLYQERLSTYEWDINVQRGQIGSTPETPAGDRQFQRSEDPNDDPRPYHGGVDGRHEEYDNNAEEVISLLEEGATIFDEDERLETYHEWQEKLADDCFINFLAHGVDQRAAGNWVNNYRAYAGGLHDNFYELWLDEDRR